MGCVEPAPRRAGNRAAAAPHGVSRGLGGRGRRDRGQRDRETAALATTGTVGRDLAALALDELAHEREADAEASLRSLRHVLRLREELEQLVRDRSVES